MSRCGTVFNDEEQIILEKIAKLERLANNNSNPHEASSALEKANQLKQKLEQTLWEKDKETLTELGLLANRLEWQAEQIRYAIAYCIRNETLKGLDEMVAYSFNSQQHTPQYGGGGGGLPAGANGENVKYKCVIINSSQQNVEKNGMVTGGYLALELTPIEGPLSGTKHTDRLNLHHTNPQTVEIANKQLSAYCHVTGKFQFTDTAELHNIPLIVEIGLQKEPNPNKYTEVKAIFDINGNQPGKAGAGPQVQQQQPAPPMQPPAQVQATGQWQQPPAQQPAPGVDNNVAFPGQQQSPAQAGWGQPPAQQQAPAQQPPAQQQWGAQGGAPAQQPPGWGAPAQ